ncbi:MAG: ArsA family ATPase [Syntrophales bacterium]|nr:ArsA family ATPase [Syntrophales bacterium]
MKIIFFTGKGGVGKSTISAAAAWQLSHNHRVLIVSLDPAHNLGDVFNVSLNDKKHKYSDTLFLQEIDLQKLSRDYLKREIDVLSGTYRYLQTLNLDNYFSVLKYSPGIEEYALLTSIETIIRQESAFDFILFDTPPTGLTLRFLALPRVTITWIERLIQIRRMILEKRYTIHRLRGNLDSAETILSYREDDDDALRRLKKLNENYQRLNIMLQGDTCSIILVCNPDLLSLKESQRLMSGLDDLKLPLRAIVDNKVTEESSDMAEYVEKQLRNRTAGIPVQRIRFSQALTEKRNDRLFDIEEDLTHLVSP